MNTRTSVISSIMAVDDVGDVVHRGSSFKLGKTNLSLGSIHFPPSRHQKYPGTTNVLVQLNTSM